MSQAEELLNSLNEFVPEHSHNVVDSDTYFIIDPIKRTIENTARQKNVLMQRDHESERFTFELPRYVEGHDMSLCNVVKVHWNNIDGETGEENADVTDIYDLNVNPVDEDTVICSWLITRHSTQLVGILSFLIQYACEDAEGNLTYEWHSDSYDDIEIKKGRNNDKAAVIEYSSILEQWRARLFGAGDSVLTNIASAGEEQIATIKKTALDSVTEIETKESESLSAIELKGQETLDSIPEDYTTTHNMADEAMRTKADAIRLDVEGETIVVTDSACDPLRNLKVFGKSTQFVTSGAQLISTTLSGSMTVSGLTIAPTDNGNLNVNGTHVEGAMWLEFGKTSLVAGKTYTLSCTDGFSIHLWDLTNSKEYRTKKSDVTSITIEASESIECAVVLNDAVLNRSYSNVTVDAILIEGDTVVPWEPYTGGVASPNSDYPQEIENVENPTVEFYGKNLLCPNGATMTSKGITFTNNNDGTFTVKGTSTGAVGFPLTNLTNSPIRLCKGRVYTQSVIVLAGEKPTRAVVVPAVIDSEGVKTFNYLSDNQTKVANKDYMFYSYTLYFDAGVTADFTFKVQLECNETATEYESYVQVQSLTIPYELRGIPVESGGNYTDSNGQQWISDEIDFERGVYVQRIKSVYLDKAEENNAVWGVYNSTETQGLSFTYWSDDVQFGFHTSLCSHFINVDGAWGAPYLGQTGIYSDHDTARGKYFRPPASITTLDEWKIWLAENKPILQYVLAAPIETPLTDEELAAYKALYTNKPNTTIQNGVGAHMEASYNADTLSFLRSYIRTTINEIINETLP